MQLRTFLVLIAVLALGLPAAAHASGAAVIRDCADDGKLNKQYSQKDLQSADKNLPSDIDEYTDCRAVIRAAMHGGTGSTGAPPPGAILTESGAIAGNEHDIASLAALQRASAAGKTKPVTIGGEQVTPGNAGLGGPLAGLAGSNGMPASLVTAIVALLVLAIVTAYLAAREKFPVVRRAALRVFSR
jgi:hypothetical protein